MMERVCLTAPFDLGASMLITLDRIREIALSDSSVALSASHVPTTVGEAAALARQFLKAKMVIDDLIKAK
jgi:hypothetical protein